MQAGMPLYQCFQTILGARFCLGILGAMTCIPRMRKLYCSAVISANSVLVLDHWKRPPSKRLYKSKKPSPSHNNPLSRSARRPQKRNRSCVLHLEISVAEGHLLALKSPFARSNKATFRGVGSPPGAAYKGQ